MPSTSHQPFPDTHWSLVEQAGFGEGEARRTALATLLARYEPALLSHLCHSHRMSQDQASELVQAFIADKVLEYQLLQHADKGKGRFRTLLLTSLEHFAIDKFRARQRQKSEPLIEVLQQAARASDAPAPAIFEAAWARSLVHEVLANMKNECVRIGRQDVWVIFEKRLLAELLDGQEPLPYEVLAKELELGSPTQTANLLVTGKRMYARMLRAAVAEYEKNADEIDAEIGDLCRALEVPAIE